MFRAGGAGDPAVVSVLNHLQEVFVELEVWRQNIHSVEEREALHRVMALLGRASQELRGRGEVADPAQEPLPLEP